MHNKRTLPAPSFQQRVIARVSSGLMAFAVTLLALPVNAAITLPTDPLTTNSRVPPNILFLLDDSGSMTWQYMYNPAISSISGTGINSGPTGDNRTRDSSYDTASTNLNAVYDQSYVTNTVYYNPSIDYTPWTQADGSSMSGGASYGDVYTSANLATGSANLASSTRTFYVPKTGTSAAGLSDALNYYRYQIRTDGSVIRSERLEAQVTQTEVLRQTNLSANRNSYTSTFSFVLPANMANVTITTQANNGDASIYARLNNNNVTINNYDWESTTNGTSNESISINNPAAGTYYVRVRSRDVNGASFSNLTLVATYYEQSANAGETAMGCDSSTSGWGWRNCTAITPTGLRSEAQERANFAIWYSYHRTRMKTAKAGSSRAFNDMGNDVRVGFRTIWGRNQQSGTNRITNDYPIPVNENYGLFSDPNGAGGSFNNRTEWYRRLFDASGNNGTPLHNALNAAGSYYSSNSSDGAYGPEAGSDQYQCRQNFTILTTDGYWNSYTPGSNNNQDGTAGTEITGPANAPYTYAPAAPYSDSRSDTLADVAMRYWKSDLRTDLDNIVPTSAANPAFWQHMVTFGISIGLKGNTGIGSVTAVPANYTGWPNPNDSEDADRIDDLLHAAVNGHGSFLSAGDPAEFTSGLRSALGTITERTGSFSNVAANSTRLDTDTRVFQATYVSGVWTGELTAYGVTHSGTPSLPSVSPTPSWRASQGIPTSGRDIFTYDGTAGAVFPTAAQTTALARASAPAVSGADNAAYIKGDTSRELRNAAAGVPGLRNRTNLLGDIVASSPAFVDDTDTIYVGANDGMLHAFNAVDGTELFAYVPAGINMAALSTISRPDYAHRYFVDGPTVISNRKQTPGENILVGALGKGGKGIYALDVTDPANFTAANVKWENTSGANMGLVQSKPIIAKLNNGDMGAIVSNGINSTNGRAVLFVYNLRTGALLSEIDTGVGSPVTDDPNSNGLSAPVGWDADGNGTLDYVYAGDMLGNVWKFNLSSSTSTAWDAAGNRSLLFTATYPGTPSQVQPITGGLTIALDPVTFKTWVLFGTGRFMTPGDVTSSNVQSMYGLIDEGANISRDDLQQRSIIVAGTGSNGQPVRGFQAEESLTASMKGWYIDLLTPASGVGTPEGERVVSDAQVVGDVLVFASIIPESDACQPDGRGYINALDAFTGTSTGPSFFDLDRDGNFDDETLADGGGTVPVGSVDLGVGMPTLPNVLRGLAVVGGSGGGTGGVPIRETRNVSRVSWREVIRD